MKRIYLMPLFLLGWLAHAHASSGDDVWLEIKELNFLVGNANKNIQNLWETVKKEQAKTQDLQTQIKNIPEGKAGQPGERGLPGARGPQGEKGEPGTYTAGDGITIEGDVIKVTKQTHQIGEEYRGGLVFYLDESGQHGLIASKIDVNDQGIQWRNGICGNKITNARGDGIGAGETNTGEISASNQTP